MKWSDKISWVGGNLGLFTGQLINNKIIKICIIEVYLLKYYFESHLIYK